MHEAGDTTADRKAIRWLRFAIALWITFAGAQSVKTIIDPWSHSVYPNFHIAGQEYWGGRSIYVHPDGHKTEFFYSPAFAACFAPLSRLGITTGSIIWSLASLGIMFHALRVFFRDVIRPQGGKFFEGQYLALALATAIQGGWSAQSNSLVIALILLGGTSLLKQRSTAASFLFAAAMHIKVWPIIAPCLLGVKYARELLWRIPIALAVCGVIPFLTSSSDHAANSYRTWIERLAQRELTEGDTVQRYGGYRDMWTVFENTIGPPQRRTYKLLQAGCGLAILAWCVRNHYWGMARERWLLSTLAWWCIWQLLFGPGTERLTYGILAPFAAWGVLESARLRRYRALAWPAWWLTGLLGTGEVERMLLKIWSGSEIFVVCGVVLFAAWLWLEDRADESGLRSPAAHLQ